jgi:hypothetical protein
MKSTEYNSDIIQAFADKLYSQANTIVATSTVLGLIIGGVGGFAALQNAVGAIVGAIMLGLIGFSIGQGRASALKLQAQTALCQVQVEKNTRR